ncbi:MAG: nitrilase family protein [Paludibacteraceae bacterium]|nr:nitrilase family protein [Paludibacteraceae bacterium]
MKDLQIITVQYDIISNQPQHNLETISALIEEAMKSAARTNSEGEELATLVVLPEMMTCGFSMDSHLCAEDSNNSESIAFLKNIATSNNIYICGSLPINEAGKVFNRCVFIAPDNSMTTYDKKHLFSIGFEREAYADGTERVVVICEGWKILLSICYDVRFPVWLRNRKLDYDVMINVANWPTVRIDGWKTLLKARAIENQAYVVGVNRTGRDTFDAEYPGDSHVIDFKGKIIAENNKGNSFCITTLQQSPLCQFRKKFAAWKDADDFQIL